MKDAKDDKGAQKMRLYFNDIFPFIGMMLLGLKMSIILAVLSMFLGIIIGFALCLCKLSNVTILRLISIVYIEVIRNTPLLVQLYILYFGLAQLGIDLSPFVASSIAMIINAGAYIAEIFRGSFLSIPNGLVEAAESLGMGRLQILRYVLFKLLFKNAFPGLINQFILMFLFSSVASTIALSELTYVTFNLQSSTSRIFEVLIISGAMYYIVTALSVAIMNWLRIRLFSWK